MVRALIALLGLLALPAAAAESEPRAWLAEMNDAFNSVSYDGVFSFFSGSELASLRIVHMVIDGVQHERLIHQNGAPREIVRVGEEVVCILMPGDDLLSLEANLPAGPFARSFVRRYDSISDYYGLKFFGEDRIADREAVRLAVIPANATMRKAWTRYVRADVMRRLLPWPCSPRIPITETAAPFQETKAR